ncbi:MAG: MFS transporter [Proteobacteria bacterium]|nr:MFS transporter [Pseudomonadota bacterium]
MLLAVYIFNFLDRQLLAILAQPIKADLGLSDAQLGLLGGLAFAMLYSTVAIPLGSLADRLGRARVITASLAVWSLFTALCGMATSFTQLFIARLGVGVGEAGGVAPSYALVAERFPLHQRARAIAVYTLGVPLGAALGAFLGAKIAHAVNWRVAFAVMGGAGLVFALPFAMVVRDAPQPAPEPGRDTGVAAVFTRLAQLPAFWLIAFGAGVSSLCGYGFLFWAPSLFQRSYHLSMVQTGAYFGVQTVVAGVAGIMAGGWLADWLGHRSRGAYALVPGLAYLACAPAYVLSFQYGSASGAIALMLIPSVLGYVWLGPVTTAIQHLVPAPERATASACYLLINNGVGMGVGPWLIGRLSDHLTAGYGVEALRMAMTITAGFYLIAATLMLLGSRQLARAWVS